MWWTFSKKSHSGFSVDSTAEEVTEGIDGFGLSAIITGATRGIGFETARVLALRGVHVIMAVRNVVSGTNVKDNILKEISTAKIDVMEVDISSLDSIRKFTSEFISSGLPLNILINNAGVKGPFQLSKDNIELTFATNHLGHFLLTNLLLETMNRTSERSGKEGRIINVSSMSHSSGGFLTIGVRFDKWYNGPRFMHSNRSYIISKLANILHANELARQLKEKGYNITANSLHPGVVDTDMLYENDVLQKIYKAIFRFSIINVQQGAATTCYVALHPQVKGISGQYYGNCNLSKASARATNVDLAKELWDFSINLVNKTQLPQ